MFKTKLQNWPLLAATIFCTTATGATILAYTIAGEIVPDFSHKAMAAENIVRRKYLGRNNSLPDSLKLIEIMDSGLRHRLARLQWGKEEALLGIDDRFGPFRLQYISNNKIYYQMLEEITAAPASERSYSLKMGESHKTLKNKNLVKEIATEPAGSLIERKIERKKWLRYLEIPLRQHSRMIHFRNQFRDGAFLGFQISKIDQTYILYRLGIRKNDIITKINHHSSGDLAQLLRLYKHLTKIETIAIELIRGSEIFRIQLRIV